MECPLRSRDIVEAVRDYLDEEKVKKNPSNFDDLWNVLEETWHTIPQEFLTKPFESVPRGI